MHTCMYSLFSRFFQIRNAHVLISPGHDILLVSFVLWSVLEYNDAKCKINLKCDKKILKFLYPVFCSLLPNGFDTPSIKLASHYYLSLKDDFLYARNNLILI